MILRRTGQALRLAICRWAASDRSGATSSTASISGRRLGTHQLYALTCPLLTTASGAKMGKTASGAVWLNADMLSPWDYWQFLAQYRRRRCGPLHAPVHAPAHRRRSPVFEVLKGAEINEAKKKLADEGHPR